MGIARKATIVFLSFLLFISLSGIGFGCTAGRTVLQPDFIISRIDELDVTVLVEDVMRMQIPPEIDSVLSEEYVEGLIGEVVVDLEPWIRVQAADAVNEGYDYILGESQKLMVTVDLGQAKTILRDSIWRTISETPPSWLEMLPEPELESIYYTLYDDLSAGFPDILEIDEATLDSLDPQIMPLLDKAKRYIGYYRIIYSVSIGATAALIAGIILLNERTIKRSTFWIGIPCLVCGIFAFLTGHIVTWLAGLIIPRIELPGQLPDWLGGILIDSVAPLTPYGVAMILTGASLLIISIVYGRRRGSGSL